MSKKKEFDLEGWFLSITLSACWLGVPFVDAWINGDTWADVLAQFEELPGLI